jgi:EmrB/QacA subfamily drug resistance transporter
MSDLGTAQLADPRRWAALSVLLAGGFLPPLDFNVVNLALPAIAHDLHASGGQLELVMTAYTCTYAVLLITGGRLGDRFGRRLLFVTGVALFTGASLLCGLATSAALLIGGRALQAAGASLLAPQVIASIRDLFPTREQPVAISLYGAAFGLAFVAGQVFGGFVIGLHLLGLTWQPVFLINVPLGVAVLIGAATLVRNTRQSNPAPLDLIGVLIGSATLFSLVYPLVSGGEAGWPAWECALLGMSVLLAGAFYFWEAHVARLGGAPLVDFSLMRAPSMVFGVPVALLFYTTSAIFLVIPEYLQSGLHFDAFQSALRMLPLCLAYFAVSMLSTRMSSALGAAGLMFGLIVLVAGMAGVITCARAPLAIGFYIGQVLIGSGFGLLMPSIVGTLVRGLDPRHAGLASGVLLSSLQIGAALGVALFAGVYFAALHGATGQSVHVHALRLALTLNTTPLLLAIGLSARLVRLDKSRRDAVPAGAAEARA